MLKRLSATSIMQSTMLVARNIPRLGLNTRLFPRLALRTTALSMRHVPLASSMRHFSAPANPTGRPFPPLDTYPARHIGPNPSEAKQMLVALGYDSMDAFVRDTVPDSIRVDARAVSEHSIPALSESEMLKRAEEVANMNEKTRSFIGMGYWNAVVPQVILRNVCRHCHFCSRRLSSHLHLLDFGKSIMVYTLYSLPARDCPGATRVAHQLPNDGLLAHRSSHC
jgi:hypothetical protein